MDGKVYLVEYWRSWDAPDPIGIFTTADAAEEVLTGLGFTHWNYEGMWRKVSGFGSDIQAKITPIELDVIQNEP